MSYYMSTLLDKKFYETIAAVTDALHAEGFGVLTDIDVKATLKEKLNVDFQNYRILGACNPPFAYKALQTENKIGTMLPCNVIVREQTSGAVEVAAVDPVSSMAAIENDELRPIAKEIKVRLQRVIESLSKQDL